MDAEEHGTNAAYARHQRLGEVPCDICKAGKSEYDRDISRRPHNRKRIRARGKAQHRAIQELVDIYRPLYNSEYAATSGDVTKKQRRARQAVVNANREEYRELYVKFREEEYANIS